MADVSVDTTISSVTTRGMRSVVFTTALIGYVFYIDSDGTFGYSKTTDGGATWGAQVEIASATTHVAFDVWFDQWTPGDSGTLIHLWYFNTTTSDVFWRTLDTNGDTLGTEQTAFNGASAVAGRGAFCSGTKTRSGYLYVAFDIDAGAEHGIVRSTDSGTTWSSNLSAGFVEATIDQCLLFPATGTGDNNDVLAPYQDASADELTMKMWDSSAAAEVESASMQTMIEGTTDLTGQMGFGGALFANGDLFVVSFSERKTATADLQCWTVNAVNAGSLTGITAGTNITTNINQMYHPSAYINRGTDKIYVAYNGKKDGSELLDSSTKIYYVASTDGGSTWSAEQAYGETASALERTWTPVAGSRFYVTWRVGTSLKGNAVNSVALNAYTMAAAQGSYALSGFGPGLLRGRLIAPAQGSLALTGETVVFATGKNFPVDQGSYSLAGQAANFSRTRIIQLDQGNYLLAGQSISLRKGQGFPIDQGQYDLTGENLAISRSRILSVAAGFFALDGQVAILLRGRAVLMVGAAYSFSGQPVVLRQARKLNVGSGTFQIAGQTVELRRGIMPLLVQGGVYQLEGRSLTLRRIRILAAIQGGYLLSGQTAQLSRGRKVTIVGGSYALTGQVVLFRNRKLVAATGFYVLNLQQSPHGIFIPTYFRPRTLSSERGWHRPWAGGPQTLSSKDGWHRVRAAGVIW